MIAVINGREELINEIENAEPKVKDFIAKSFEALLINRAFISSIPGHLNDDPGREEIVI